MGEDVKEAQARWTKKLKAGYVQSIAEAEAGVLDAAVEGGIVPMLAHVYKSHSDKIKFPALVQRKLDGVRCVAILKNGVCTLWSRTRKPITGVPHIARAVEKAFAGRDIVLDGECYLHTAKTETVGTEKDSKTDFNINFEHIVSMVRQETPQPGHEKIEYHIYDVVSSATYQGRAIFLADGKWPNDVLKRVESIKVANENEMLTLFHRFLDEGYEGLMVRNLLGLYVNKRSYDLQKVKSFCDDEFKIVGIEEGRGKLMGHAAAFVCEMSNGKIFSAKMKGKIEKLKEYFDNEALWRGRWLTVSYFGLTAYGIPRFPVGVRFRDGM